MTRSEHGAGRAERRRAHAAPVPRLLSLLAVLLLAVACTGGKSASAPSSVATPAAAAAAPARGRTPEGGASVPAGPTTAVTPAPAAAFSGTAAVPATATPTPAPRPLVPEATPPAKIEAGTWGEVNTLGGCLKVRLSFEQDSQAIDCLPYRLLVFVDSVQTVQGQEVVHLAGRGYTYPEGLTPLQNPAETFVDFAARPHDLGTVAYTAPDGNVWTIAGDGSGARQITGAGGDQNAGVYYSGLAWSHDGRELLLSADTDSGRLLQVYDAKNGLHTVSAPGSASGGYPGAASWSSDSFHLLVADYDLPGNACERDFNRYALQLVDRSNNQATDLYSGTVQGFVAGIAPSPDGRYIALLLGAACDSVSFDLCLLSLQADPAYAVKAGQLRCPRGAKAGSVAWSPDSKQLAFTSRLQGRDDESQLSVGLPMNVLEPHSATYYPLAWPLRIDRNIIGAVYEPDSRTLRIEEEVPRGLADIELPDRIIRRITSDGSRAAITEAAGDRLLDLRPLLAPATVHGEYALASGATGALWVIQLGQQDARWQLTDVAAGVYAWNQ
ncbi:MAG TPA: hypothetical protein VKV26_11915 [Dehalococcoidia bacterium]|nr:hypothetical protein [Dehalococcoidia bacterium]